MSLLASPVHAERFIELCGTCNARDLGGLPLDDGGTTRSGHFVRADAPLHPRDGDAGVLARLGVTTVIDLRDADEIRREPNALSRLPGVTVHHVDLWAAVRAARATHGPPADPWDLAALYAAALDHAGPAFVLAVEHLARSDGAVVFHCTAGKDRTGLLAALVLEVVGVGRETILEDYALTHDRIEGVRSRLLAQGVARGIRPEDYGRLLGATPELLEAALTHLHRRYGGAAGYLVGAGAAPAALARLTERLA